MKVSTFDQDFFELEEFASRLEQFIEVEREFVDGSLVLGLSSSFGSGKSTFLDMWTHSLATRPDGGAPTVVSLNAWESDYWGDPLFAIISAFVDELETKGAETGGLRTAAKDIGWFFTAIASQVAAKVSGIDPIEAGEFSQRKKDERESSDAILPDTFTVYRERRFAMGALKRELATVIAAANANVWFLVDELDRCRPDYAVTYLETIKHIFDIPGAVFILAADRQHLENSAKTAFGQDLNFDEYYRKFVHREVVLPQLQEKNYLAMSRAYVNHYLEPDGGRFTRINLAENQVESITQFIAALRLTPRQTQEVFRVVGHVCSAEESNRGQMYWCIAIGTVLMSALKAGEPELFHKLGNQEVEADELLDYLRARAEDHVVEWWFSILLTGGGIKMLEEDTQEGVMVRAGIASYDDDNRYRGRDLGEYRSGWGISGGEGRLRQAYLLINEIGQWN